MLFLSRKYKTLRLKCPRTCSAPGEDAELGRCIISNAHFVLLLLSPPICSHTFLVLFTTLRYINTRLLGYSCKLHALHLCKILILRHISFVNPTTMQSLLSGFRQHGTLQSSKGSAQRIIDGIYCTGASGEKSEYDICDNVLTGTFLSQIWFLQVLFFLLFFGHWS